MSELDVTQSAQAGNASLTRSKTARLSREAADVTYRRIVVPIDGLNSEHAIPWARAIAMKSGGMIELVHANPPAVVAGEMFGGLTMNQAAVQEENSAVEERLRQLASVLEGENTLAGAAVIGGADVGAALAEHIQQSKSDVVVMTTHHRGRLEHLLMGSVSGSVVRHVHVPVLLVSTADGAPSSPSAACVEHILLPLDGSEFANQIVPHAAALARLMGARITLLSVVERMLATAASSFGVEAFDATRMVEEHTPAWHSRELARVAGELRAQGIAVETQRLVDADPARAILAYTASHNVDVIAMTTHGSGALKRLAVGSVAESVLDGAPTTVLMYRPARGT